MKISSRDRYLHRIDRVIHRLSSVIANQESLPSTADLARDAHLSEFHFMRVYRALAGESLGATLQRLRLAQALHLLMQTSAPVSDIAGRVGFETPQAFARAFRQAHGISPTEARNGAPLKSDLPTAPRDDIEIPIIRVEVVELEPFRAIALRNIGAYADLDQAYSRLFAWLADRGAVETIAGIWGVPHHDRRDTRAEDSVFDCCLATAAELEPDGTVSIIHLGGGSYARYRHVGPYPLLDDAHDRLLRDALPAQGLELRDQPILHEFLNDPEGTPESQLETRIYLPVQRSSGEALA